MKRDGRGRTACKLSPYHMRVHAEAHDRAAKFAALRATGLDYHTIGQRFGCSASAVYHTLKRQGMLKPL